MSSRPSRHAAGHAFTLLEVLAALALAATIMAALGTVLSGAYRLQRQAQERESTFAPRLAARDLLRRDLAGAMPSTGILAGTFVGTSESQGEAYRDRAEFVTANGATSPELSTGAADLVQVAWYVVESDVAGTYTLVRTAMPILLATAAEEAEEEEILTRVTSFQLSWYSTADGDWRDAWDSTAEENALPAAVRIRIAFASPLAASGQTPAERAIAPLEMIVPLPVQPAATTLTAPEATTDIFTPTAPTPNGGSTQLARAEGGSR